MTTSTAWLLAAWQSRPASRVHRGTAPNPMPTTTSSRPRLHDDRGEGVISVAIAVLIMAFLGAAMWVGFQSMWSTTSERTNEQVEQIGVVTRGDRGAGLIGTSAAVMVFLVFLLFAVQLLVGLYGRSVVTSTAYDGARTVAGSRVDHDDPVAVGRAQSAAVERMRQQLGRVGEQATFDWTGSDADTVVLRVQADNPRFSFPGFGGPLATDHIDRTVHARIERVR